MKLFNKKKESIWEPKLSTKSYGTLVGFKCFQSGWADWMTRNTKRFSRCTWVVLLILFVLSVSTYSVYLGVNAIKGNGSNSISITPIKKPKHTTETGETNIAAVEVSEAEYRRIKKFSVYMDSLVRSPSGKILYDRITRLRPGLVDSVRFIESYYQQLNQK